MGQAETKNGGIGIFITGIRVPIGLVGIGADLNHAERSGRPGIRISLALRADERAGLRRHLRRREGGSAPRGEVDGRAVVVFSSNDYLGLSVHPEVREAAARAALELGVGATGSRHLSGGHGAITDLEEALAGFLGAATATVAPSGYAANVSILEALGGSDATILSDAGNHASLIDGSRASRSQVAVYRHLDSVDLEARLARVEGRPIIVTDSIFSMDGAAADLIALDRLARRHDAWLVVDEAHKLSLEVLEEIRLLGNFESANEKWLQIALVGQSELDELLNRETLRQFKQRISLRLTIEPLSETEIEQYIQFRWRKAGGSAAPFSASATV